MITLVENKKVLSTIKAYLTRFTVVIVSLFSYLPVFGGILGAMILAAGVLRHNIYFIWEVMLYLLSMFPNHPFQEIHVFTGLLKIPTYLGSTLVVLGYILMIIGIISFLLGIIELTKGVVKKHEFVYSGIYKYVRHPQNLGLILIGLGLMLTIPQLQGWPKDYTLRIGDIYSWTLFSFIWLIEAKWEENRLICKLGFKYSEYQEKTLFFIPYGTKIEKFLAILFDPHWRFRSRFFLWIAIYFLFFVLSSYLLSIFQLYRLTH